MHQGGSTEAVCTVVGEVTFTDGEQSLDGGHQFVVNPDTTHGIVDSRINHHRVFVWADISDFFIHIEEVAVTLCNDIFTQTVDSFGEVKEYGKTGVVHAEALVAAFFGSAAGNVTRNEVTECRIAAFQVVVAVFLGNIFSLQCTFLQFLGVFQLLRNPNAAIVTQGFGHQSQFGLLVTVNRDTSGVNLYVSRVGKPGTFTVASHCSRAVTCHCIGRKEVGIAVTTGSDYHSVGGKTFQFTGNEVLSNDTAGTSVNEDNVFHFVAGIQFHSAYVHLAAQCRVCTQQQLLSGLTLGIESTGYLGTTERTVVQCTAVFAGERNTLRNALVDNIVGYFSQTVNIGFAGTVVATLYCIVEQTVHRVAVVLVILSGIDTTLCSDGVCTARRVLDAEVEYSETHFAQRSGSTGTGKSGSYYDDVQTTFVGRVH